MAPQLPEGWRISSTDHNAFERDAQKIAKFYPILPIHKKGMIVGNERRDFHRSDWEKILRKSTDEQNQDGTFIRVYDACKIDSEDKFIEWESIFVSYDMEKSSWSISYGMTLDYPANLFVETHHLTERNGVSLDISQNPNFPQPLGRCRRFYFDAKNGKRIYFLVPTEPFEIESVMRANKADPLLRGLLALDGGDPEEQWPAIREMALNEPERTMIHMNWNFSKEELLTKGIDTILSFLEEVGPVTDGLRESLLRNRTCTNTMSAAILSAARTTATGFRSKGPVIDYLNRKKGIPVVRHSW